MEVHYNLAASLIGTLFGFLILFSILINSHLIREAKNHKYNRWLIYMIVVCLIGSISEGVFEIINGKLFPFSRELNILVKTTNHIESIFAGFIFIGFVRALTFEDERTWPNYIKTIAIAVCTSGVVLMIVNLFTGIVFTVSDDNLYSRGPLGQLGLIISFVTLIYTVFILVIENKKSKTYLRFPVLIYILPFLIGGGLQVTVPSLRLSSVSFALGIATAHLSIQRNLLYTDSMTGVYNRTYLDYFFRESMKKGQNKSFGGLLIDINSFKEINDTYGHMAGDEAIRNAANVLKETSGSDYLIIRYGGDEFVLIKENLNIDDLKLQKEKINAAVKEFNETSTNPYELAFAVGTTVYQNTQGEFHVFLEQMDKSLYQDKKEYYEKTGKERRR